MRTNCFGRGSPPHGARHGRGRDGEIPRRFEPAIREFEQAVKLAPDWPDPYYNLGLAQENTGKLKEAIANLKEYLRLAPNAPDAANILDQIYKLEYKADQVLTVPDIIDVLISLSDEHAWQITGDCSKETIKFRRSNLDSYVYVMSASHLEKAWFRDEKFKGPILKYYFLTHKYAPGKCVTTVPGFIDKCFGMEELEVTVKSKTLVKVDQRVLRNIPFGHPELAVVAGRSSCTYLKK